MIGHAKILNVLNPFAEQRYQVNMGVPMICLLLVGGTLQTSNLGSKSKQNKIVWFLKLSRHVTQHNANVIQHKKSFEQNWLQMIHDNYIFLYLIPI